MQRLDTCRFGALYTEVFSRETSKNPSQDFIEVRIRSQNPGQHEDLQSYGDILKTGKISDRQTNSNFTQSKWDDSSPKMAIHTYMPDKNDKNPNHFSQFNVYIDGSSGRKLTQTQVNQIYHLIKKIRGKGVSRALKSTLINNFRNYINDANRRYGWDLFFPGSFIGQRISQSLPVQWVKSKISKNK